MYFYRLLLLCISCINVNSIAQICFLLCKICISSLPFHPDRVLQLFQCLLISPRSQYAAPRHRYAVVVARSATSLISVALLDRKRICNGSGHRSSIEQLLLCYGNRPCRTVGNCLYSSSPVNCVRQLLLNWRSRIKSRCRSTPRACQVRLMARRAKAILLRGSIRSRSSKKKPQLVELYCK